MMHTQYYNDYSLLHSYMITSVIEASFRPFREPEIGANLQSTAQKGTAKDKHT